MGQCSAAQKSEEMKWQKTFEGGLWLGGRITWTSLIEILCWLIEPVVFLMVSQATKAKVCVDFYIFIVNKLFMGEDSAFSASLLIFFPQKFKYWIWLSCMINICLMWKVTDGIIANRMNKLDHDNLKTVDNNVKLNFSKTC